MLEIDLMYELYTKEIQVQMYNLKLKIEKIEEAKQEFQKVIVSKKTFFENHTNVSLETVLDFKTNKALTAVRFPLTEIKIENKVVNVSAIKMYITQYIELRKSIKRLENHIKNFKTQLISFEIYKDIIVEFNKLSVDSMIGVNHYFKFNAQFGAISVIQNENSGTSIDWDKSIKKKNKLIEQNLIPYVKEDAKKAAENNEEYLGQFWLVYNPKLDFYWHWFRHPTAISYNPLILNYRFVPARGQKSIVKKLKDAKKDRALSLIKYTRTPNKTYNATN